MTSSDEKRFWIISYSGSDADDVCSYVAYGTEEEAAQRLLGYCEEDTKSDQYDYGSADNNEVEWQNGHIYAVSVFHDRHYDYTATPVPKLALNLADGSELSFKLKLD